jgi:hypothetical protein
VTGAVAVASLLGAIGADSRWVAALGEAIVDRGSIPRGVPFASAPTADWPNVLVAAELAFHVLNAAGDRGLLAAQVGAVAIAFTILAVDARREGATDPGTAVVLLIVLTGAFTSVAVIRLQLFSLALFPLALVLLRSETRRPSRRIWLLVPLFALWGNLHGAVLVGLAVAAAYLVLERARLQPWVGLAVLVASAGALLATPALAKTPAYYRDVLTNEAAKRGVGLWEPLSLRSPLDVVLVVAALGMLAFAIRARPRLWELAALAGLAVLTARTARSGVWLLFVAAAPAARGLGISRAPRTVVAGGVGAALAAAAVIGLVRGPLSTGASEPVLDSALEAAAGTPILAEDVLAEQIALAGGRIWVGNPIDAFERPDQRLYLDWLEGLPPGDAAVGKIPRVVLVHEGGDSERRLVSRGSVRELARDDNAVAYLRRHR